jgi:DnaJ-class molecular chaperone
MAHQLMEAGETCPSCGGSGVLRTDSAGYRTCLECVGQGVQPDFQRQALAASPAVLSQWLARSSRSGFRGDLSAWISGAR